MSFRKTVCAIIIICFFSSCSPTSKDELVLPSQDTESNSIKHSYHPRSEESIEVPTPKTEASTGDNIEVPTPTAVSSVKENELKLTSVTPKAELTLRLISYKNQSVGEFNSTTTKEEIDKILTLKNEKGNISTYEEAFVFEWNEEGRVKNLALMENANVEFLSDDPNKKIIQIGEGIRFTNIQSELRLFFISLYNIFEDTRINCIEEKKCFLIQNLNIPGQFGLALPKMNLWFSLPIADNSITLKTVIFNFKESDTSNEVSLGNQP